MKLDMLNNDILQIVVIVAIVYTVKSVIVMCFVTFLCSFWKNGLWSFGYSYKPCGVDGQIKAFPWLANFLK